MKTKSFKDLIVWQKSYSLVLDVYKLTKNFPHAEIYGLSSQMRRAAISIPSNISEGYARQHRGEYKQFLSIAYGSLTELKTQILLGKDLGYLNGEQFGQIDSLSDEVSKMLYRMLNPLYLNAEFCPER